MSFIESTPRLLLSPLHVPYIFIYMYSREGRFSLNFGSGFRGGGGSGEKLFRVEGLWFAWH